VTIAGHDAATAAGSLAIKAQLGYLPQELGLYPNLTAFEFLDYVAMLKGIHSRAARRQEIVRALEQVHLSDVAGRRLKTYSGGMKRRVGIAQAILGNPSLIIVDEPTAGLDPEGRVRLRNLLSDLSTDRTVILSTHIVEDISTSCEDLAVLNEGKLLYHGSPQNLMALARDGVWTIDTSDGPPDGNLTVVSRRQKQDTTEYRVLGTPTTLDRAMPVEPNLEDGYMWLMAQNR